MVSQIFWFGDLNYRINMLDTELRKLAAQKQWDELRNFDQVTLVPLNLYENMIYYLNLTIFFYLLVENQKKDFYQ